MAINKYDADEAYINREQNRWRALNQFKKFLPAYIQSQSGKRKANIHLKNIKLDSKLEIMGFWETRYLTGTIVWMKHPW